MQVFLLMNTEIKIIFTSEICYKYELIDDDNVYVIHKMNYININEIYINENSLMVKKCTICLLKMYIGFSLYIIYN